MSSEERKLHLIEDVLRLESDEILIAIETVLNTYKNASDKVSIHDFSGIISKEEAAEMKKAIAETCESIDENDYK